MLKVFYKYKGEKPLLVLLIIAFIPRLIAVLFSKGYGMHDDHFLVIEAAQGWVDGYDYNGWIPRDENSIPTGHSWFYVGLHYLLFSGFQFLGINDPQLKMYFIRAIHALYSLLVIPPVFYLIKSATNQKYAFQMGLVVALLFFMPLMGVRNLVEMVSTVPLLWALWVLYKNKDQNSWRGYILSGLLLGLAVGIRFQTILFAGGVGLVLLFQRKVFQAAVLGLVFLLTLFLTQMADLFIWGYPFAEIGEYIRYNIENKETYFSMPWYHYFGTIIGLLLPPMSIVWLLGYFKSYKKFALIFWPSFLFFAFHCYFPNKQERFILPMFPIIITLGSIAWFEFLQTRTSPNWKNWNKRFMTFFWIINSILLAFVTPAYSKKSRVESMYWVGKQSDYKRLIVESSAGEHIQMPVYYANKWLNPLYIKSSDDYKKEYISQIIQLPIESRPNYVLFFQGANLENRINEFQDSLHAQLNFVKEFEPSYLDLILYKLNPNNTNQTAFLYKINYEQ